MKMVKNISKKEVYKFGIAYIALITVIAAIFNYFTWHSKYSSSLGFMIVVLTIMLWIAFYVPMYVFIKRDAWSIRDFGFVVNKRLIIISIILVLFIIIKLKLCFSFAFVGYILLEAFARVGEEVFYRGFIYTFSLKLFNGKQNSWIWAIFISSLMFAIIHTHTFLPDNQLNILSIFLSALILGLLRFWTDSILPGIIIHCVANGGILCMLAGILLYVAILIIAYFIERNKKESNIVLIDNED